MKRRPPCKGCEDRFIGCHTECSRFAAYREKVDQEKAAILKEKEKEADLLGYYAERKARTK